MFFFLLTVGKTDNTFIEEQICKKISKRVLETMNQTQPNLPQNNLAFGAYNFFDKSV